MDGSDGGLDGPTSAFPSLHVPFQVAGQSPVETCFRTGYQSFIHNGESLL